MSDAAEELLVQVHVHVRCDQGQGERWKTATFSKATLHTGEVEQPSSTVALPQIVAEVVFHV